ncbi:MAG: DNA polymerase III subunit gamma/tau, partial [Anaerolineae bacterium]|nr:DNA polymerase III subunit gamma/tau [Anaerolineae bacterium]
MPAQALYLKWRPQTFEDLIGQEHITRTLRNALRQGRIRHAYLFSGPRGTGKTSTARLLAKAVNCQAADPDRRPCNECAYCVAVNEGRFLDLIEIDAASHTGVDDVRDLRDKIAYAPSEGQYKVYIIDEVHRFSGAAFDALLKTLEEPPAHAIFVLATTEIAKVPATIKSRCLIFEFRRVPLAEVVERLALIAESEGVSIDQEALELIGREGTGSVRDSISLLDQLMADPDEHITLDMAEQILGTASGQNVVELAQALIENNAAWGLDIINTAIDGGSDPRQFGRQVIEYLRQVVLVKMGGDDLVDATQERRAVIHEQADLIGRKALLAAIRAFNGAVQDWYGGWQPQLPLELAFLESIKPVVEDEPEPALRPRAHVRTQDDLPPPVARTPEPDRPPQTAGEEPVEALAIQVADVHDQWTEVQRAARQHHPSLPALLDHAVPRDIRGDTLTLGVKLSVFKQKLDKDHARDALQETLFQVFGVPLHVKVIVTDAPDDRDEELGDLLAHDDVLAFGVNELGGEITEIDGDNDDDDD